MKRRDVIRTSRLACSVMLLSLASCAGGDERPPEIAQDLIALPATDHTGARAREPMIVQAPDGALFVSGYGEDAPLLWRSGDNGTTWSSVNVGTPADGAVGNSDVDLAIAPDGTLYFVAMSFDRNRGEGRGIAVGTSRDGGASWTWTSLSRDRFDDRPWVKVAPDGTAHAIWNDGAGVSHAVSSDRGVTWSERPRIHTLGGSSHLAISAAGAIAARITPVSASGNKFDSGVDRVAVSTDEGSAWALRELPGTRDWAAFSDTVDFLRWVEPVAWDSAGALFSLWSEGKALWIARSTNQGASWTRWPIVNDSTTLYFPYLIARGNGELAATWFSGLRDSVRANVARISVSADSSQAPVVRRAERFAFPAVARSDTSAKPLRETAGEYIPILFLRDGGVAVVTTIQDRAQNRFGFSFRPFR